MPKFFALYLLLSIGFRGGVELHKSGINHQIVLTLLAAVAVALVVPLYTFFLLRRKMNVGDAAAVAATYGSVSAILTVSEAEQERSRLDEVRTGSGSDRVNRSLRAGSN